MSSLPKELQGLQSIMDDCQAFRDFVLPLWQKHRIPEDKHVGDMLKRIVEKAELYDGLQKTL